MSRTGLPRVVFLPPEGDRKTMSTNLAVVVDPDAPGRLVIRPVPEPTADRGEALVRVHAISLNRGEVRRSGMAAAGWRPGWDLAGVIERAASDGSGPAVGTRVVGFLPEGAWAQRVVVPKNALAELPDKVTFSQAATFPVAGLTALYGFYTFTELGSEPASVGLRRLADLVAAGQLSPHISLERPWKEIGQVAQDLMARRFPGKAVLVVD